MADPGLETYQIIKSLEPRRAIALDIAITMHLVDLYRFGNMKYRASDVPELSGLVSPDRDLLDLGLELAWRFVDGGGDQPELRRPIVAMLAARPFMMKSDTWSVASNGPLYGIIDTLAGIDNPAMAARAPSRAATGVFSLVASCSDDEDAPGDAKLDEAKWQLKVAQFVRAHTDGPMHRNMFDALLGEALPWRSHLDAYRTRWSPPAPADGA